MEELTLEEEPPDVAALDVPPAEDEVCEDENPVTDEDDGSGNDDPLGDAEVEDACVLVAATEDPMDELELEREPVLDEPVEDRDKEPEPVVDVDTEPLLPAPDAEPEEDEEPGGSVVGRGPHANAASAQARGAATAVVRMLWR